MYATNTINTILMYVLLKNIVNSIVQQMTDWSQRGIDVNAALVSLQERVTLWENIMCEQLMYIFHSTGWVLPGFPLYWMGVARLST